MATQRKSSPKKGRAGKVSKAAKSAKKGPAARAGRAAPSGSKARPVRAAAAGSRAKGAVVAKGKPVPAKVASAAVAKAVGKAKPGSAGGASAAKGAQKISAAARKLAASAEVRPLGVLPPGSIARSTGKPAAPPAARFTPTASRPSAPAAPVGVQKVTEKDLKEFEQRLLEERAKILKEMGHLENTVLKVNQRDSAGDLSGYSFHMADVGTDAMEREKAFLFASAEGRTLMEINEALRRMYRGEYGVCESCGQPIARARLEAMPHARLCVVCKEKEERAHRGAL